MLYRTGADLVVAFHFAFVLFVIFGGLLLLRWRRPAWVHLPAVAWSAIVEFAGWICPLTPLENALRERGGAIAYESTFLERYVFPILYPTRLTRTLQVVLGLLVIGINVAVYWFVLYRMRRRPHAVIPRQGVHIR